MEFGVNIQGFVPAYRREVDPDAEHHALMEEIDLVIAADRAGFKYAWAPEHHFLDEYSHLSASDVVLSYLVSATERIHLGSGIFNPLPQVNHPVKVAERVAMLDHLCGGRFEFGTGRGAGSHEILGFLHRDGITNTDATREIWDDVIAEFPKMWLQDEYQGYDGKFWSLPPRKILPKPFVEPHPPMWYAAGNTSSYEMAARKGLGVLGFSVQELEQLGPVIDAYKKGLANAEPVGAYVNDNVLIVTAGCVAEDSNDAVDGLLGARMSYLQSLTFRYHDTFPRPDWVPQWPGLIPEMDRDMAEAATVDGPLVAGDPDQALAACRRWEEAGADQVVLSLFSLPHDQALETIRLLGEHVIPKLDRDPEHRTSRFRREAA